MKRLYLVRSTRHKSTTSSTLQDYHHPLSRRGEIAAIALGKMLQANGYLPEFVVCSAVTRTRQVLANIWPYLIGGHGAAPGLAHDYNIHLARGEAILRQLKQTQPGIQSLMIVSIAPGICDLARLINRPLDGVPDPFTEDLPMGAMAVFDCGINDWSELAPACGTLIKIMR
jgi:phosphohistidine phosphatase SixA